MHYRKNWHHGGQHEISIRRCPCILGNRNPAGGTMSEQVPITQQEVKQLEKLLKTQENVLCLDQIAYVKALLVARQMLVEGKNVKAKIVKGY